MKGGNLIWQPFKATIANPDYSLYLIQSNLIYFQVGPTHGSMESKAYTAVELEVIKAWLVKTTTVGISRLYQEPVNRVLTHAWSLEWSQQIRLIFSVARSIFKTFRREKINQAWRGLFRQLCLSQPTVLISSNQSTRESVITLQIVIVIVVNYKKNQVIVLVANHNNQVIVLIVILKSSDSIIQKQSDSP